jgi:hypothetical protein
MAATKRNLLSQLQRKRPHYGFGQGPIPPKSNKPKNYPLANFVLKHGRLPEGDEFEEFKKKLKAGKDNLL